MTDRLTDGPAERRRAELSSMTVNMTQLTESKATFGATNS